MQNLIETLRGGFQRSHIETEPRIWKLLTEGEKQFLLDLKELVKRIKANSFPGVNFVILAVGGMVTGVHSKPPEERDIDIAINLSAPTGSQERLEIVETLERQIKKFIERSNLSFIQHTGLLEAAGLEGRDGFKGWTLTEVEYDGQKHLVTALLDNFPQSRFVIDKTEQTRSFDIMILGLNHPPIEEHLRWQKDSGKGYWLLYDSRNA